MFTGIIQGTGRVVSFHHDHQGGKLTVTCGAGPTGGISLNGVRLGESIAVDGCCLTVVGHHVASHRRKSLVFDVSDETVRKTKVKSYRHGTVINLERAMKKGDRFGGHFVLGHVDEVGRIEQIKKNRGSTMMTVSYPKALSRYLIDKGSVALDGCSLTVALSGRNHFKIYIIPYTIKVTNMACKKAGDLVNLEMDILGKYAERLILLKK